jgi:hypothetical protein
MSKRSANADDREMRQKRGRERRLVTGARGNSSGIGGLGKPSRRPMIRRNDATKLDSNPADRHLIGAGWNARGREGRPLHRPKPPAPLWGLSGPGDAGGKGVCNPRTYGNTRSAPVFPGLSITASSLLLLDPPRKGEGRTCRPQSRCARSCIRPLEAAPEAVRRRGKSPNSKA